MGGRKNECSDERLRGSAGGQVPTREFLTPKSLIAFSLMMPQKKSKQKRKREGRLSGFIEKQQ
jgi:hypothetical protein